MNQKRTAILLVAVIVGALAAFLLFNWVQGIEDRANDGAERVQAYRATAQIPRGTPGETAAASASIEEKGIPKDIRPSSAIGSLDEIEGKVALYDIEPGTVLVQGMFVDPVSAQVSFRERLKNPTHTAITINVDATHAIAGFLVAGDEVNMYVWEEIDTTAGGEGEQQGSSFMNRRARLLYQDVQVIAIGQSALLEPGETAPETTDQQAASTLITLNVPPRAAQWIATFDSEFYLTLTPENYQPQALEKLPDTVELLPGEDPALLTPYCGPEGDGTNPCPPLVGQP